MPLKRLYNVTEYESVIPATKAVSRVLWKKRKAYSLGIPKNNWLMG